MFCGYYINKARFHDLTTEGGIVGIVTDNYYQGSVKVDELISKIEEKIIKAENLKGDEKNDTIKSIYGKMRRLIEKIVEERIFGGIILRWSERIQLLNESKATLDKSKLKTANELHGEFSKYIEAHNQSNEMIQHAIPNLDKLKTDFENVKNLSKR